MYMHNETLQLLNVVTKYSNLLAFLLLSCSLFITFCRSCYRVIVRAYRSLSLYSSPFVILQRFFVEHISSATCTYKVKIYMYI